VRGVIFAGAQGGAATDTGPYRGLLVGRDREVPLPEGFRSPVLA
jgi:hypothetical protein